LRLTVDADRPRLVLFGVRLALFAIENVIRADMNEPRVLPRADFRQDARRFTVERERFFPVRLAPVHVRLRRRVDQRIELQAVERRAHLPRLAEIDLHVIEPDDVELLPPFPRQRRAQPAARADDDYTHPWRD